MIARIAGAVVLGTLMACGGADETVPPTADIAAAPTEEATAAAADFDISCRPAGMPLDDRASPYDSVSVTLGGEEARLCYGRPSVRGREIFGTLVPYDTLWRTGANEPTTFHIPFAAEIAGVRVEPGSYSIYTVPGVEEWQVVVNRSTSQWGIESDYRDEVRAQEVGRATVPAEPIVEEVEVFTITSEPRGADAADLVMEWENTRVRIPVERV